MFKINRKFIASIMSATLLLQLVVIPVDASEGIATISIGDTTYDTIDGAVSAANATTNIKETITISEGTLTMNKVVTITDSVEIIGAGDDKTTFLGTSNKDHGAFIVNTANEDESVSIEGIKFEDFGGAQAGGIVIQVSVRESGKAKATDLAFTMTDCTIEDYGKGAIVVYGGTSNITNNKIISNVTDVAGKTPNGIQFSGASTNGTISDNQIINTVSSHDSWTSTGILLTEGANATIENNTFKGCEVGVNIGSSYDRYFQYDGSGAYGPNPETVLANNDFDQNFETKVRSYFAPENTIYVDTSGAYSFTDAKGINYYAFTYVKPNGVIEEETNCYKTVSESVANAVEGDTIVLSSGTHDVANTVIIDKDLTITGQGESTVIKGDSTKKNNGFEVTNGTVEFTNLSMSEFGNETGTQSGLGIIKVNSGKTDVNVNVDNVNFSKFNRSALDIRSGSFNVSNSKIDATPTLETTTLTKGILAGLGTTLVEGVIYNTTIQSTVSSYEAWDTSAVEVFINANVVIDQCDFSTGTIGVHVDRYYSPAGTNEVTIKNTTIKASESAVRVYGTEQADSSTGTTSVNIESGSYFAPVKVVNPNEHVNIDITGGMFSTDVTALLSPEYTLVKSNGMYTVITKEQGLNDAKNAKLAEITAEENKYKIEDYRMLQWTELKVVFTSAKAEINSLKDIELVNQYDLATVFKAAANIKTKEELNAEVSDEVDDIVGDLPVIEDGTPLTPDEKEDINNKIDAAMDAIKKVDKEDVKNDEAFIKNINQLDKAFVAANDNLEVVESAPIVSSKVKKQLQIPNLPVEVQGLALSIFGGKDIGLDTVVEIIVKQLNPVNEKDIIVLDIKPQMIVGNTATMIDNDQLQNPITMKIYLNESFSEEMAKIVHFYADGSGYEVFYEKVLSDTDGKYMELTVTQFSQFEVTPISQEDIEADKLKPVEKSEVEAPDTGDTTKQVQLLLFMGLSMLAFVLFLRKSRADINIK